MPIRQSRSSTTLASEAAKRLYEEIVRDDPRLLKVRQRPAHALALAQEVRDLLAVRSSLPAAVAYELLQSLAEAVLRAQEP